jgi:hypothetical protein
MRNSAGVLGRPKGRFTLFLPSYPSPLGDTTPFREAGDPVLRREMSSSPAGLERRYVVCRNSVAQHIGGFEIGTGPGCDGREQG